MLVWLGFGSGGRVSVFGLRFRACYSEHEDHMLTKRHFALIIVSIVSSSPASAESMSLEFSWQGTKGCVTLFPNPEIRLRNVPPGAKQLSLVLTQGVREMGGEELAVPANGIVPSGAIRTFGPCKPDIYQWTALAKSSTGKVLAEARQARFYPSDELAPEKP
jgi:hypothetical protein